MASSGTLRHPSETQPPSRANYTHDSIPPKPFNRTNFVPGELNKDEQARLERKRQRAEINAKAAEKARQDEIVRQEENRAWAEKQKAVREAKEEMNRKVSTVRTHELRIQDLQAVKFPTQEHEREIAALRAEQDAIAKELDIGLPELLAATPQPLGKFGPAKIPSEKPLPVRKRTVQSMAEKQKKAKK